MKTKKNMLLLLLLVSFLTNTAQNILTLAGGGTTGTVASFAQFGLNLQVNTPAAPCNQQVRVRLNYSSNYSTTNTNDLFVTNSQPYGGAALFNSYPLEFNPGSVVSNTVAALPGSNTMNFTLRTKEGLYCNGNTIRIQATLEFLNAAGQICNTIQSNNVQMTITAENRWTIAHQLVTPGQELCLGDTVRYRVEVNHPSNIEGSYNLYDFKVTFTAPAGAVITAVADAGGNTIAAPGTGTSSAVFPGGYLDLVVNQNPALNQLVYFVSVLYPCGVFQLNTNFATTASYTGKNPCAPSGAETGTSNANVRFERACCGCAEITGVETGCDENGLPFVIFCITNRSNFTVRNFTFAIPPNVTVTDFGGPAGSSSAGPVNGQITFSIPNINNGLQPNGTLCGFYLRFAQNNTGQVCLGTVLGDQPQEPFTNFCRVAEPGLCFTLPECLPPDTCAVFVRDSVYCDGNGNTVYQFCIRNNSDFTANVVKVKIPPGVTVLGGSVTNGTAAAGVVMGYYNFTIPAGISGGGTEYCTFRMTLGTNLTPGQPLCFGMAMHQGYSEPYPDCCEDTSYQHCITIPDCRNRCADIINASLRCDFTGQTTLTLSVRNNGLQEMGRFVVQRISGGNASTLFTQMVVPPAAPGGIAGPYTFNLPYSPLPGSTHCFRIIIYDLDTTAGSLCIGDSCIGDTVCLRAPDCKGKGEGGGNELKLKLSQRAQAETGSESRFAVFPNPVKNVLTVQSPAAAERINQIMITSSNGVIVMNLRVENVSNKTISLTGLPPGIYTVTVNRQYHFKVIKE